MSGFLVFLAIGPAGPAAAQSIGCLPPDNLVQIRADHLRLLNQLRGRNDITAVLPDPRLDVTAQNYACLLASTGHFDHVGPRGSTLGDRISASGYRYCSAAENLAKGQADIRAAMSGWVRSEGHYANLRRLSVSDMGIGAAIDGANRIVWVQVFASPCG